MSKWDFIKDTVKKAKSKAKKAKDSFKEEAKDRWDDLSDKQKKVVTHTGAAIGGATAATSSKNDQVVRVKDKVEKDSLDKEALLEELENILRN